MKQLYLTCLLSIISGFLYAQTTPYVIDANTNKCCGGDNEGMGSSFLTTAEGKLDSIKVFTRTGTYTTGTLKVFQGNSNDNSALIHEQSLTGIPAGLLDEPYMAKLSSTLHLNASSTYTFMIYNTPLRFAASDTYAGGALWTGEGFLNAGEHPTHDLDFIAYIGTYVPAPTAVRPASDLSVSVWQEEDGTLAVENFHAEEISLYNTQGKEVASGEGEHLPLNGVVSEGLHLLYLRKGNEIHTRKLYLHEVR